MAAMFFFSKFLICMESLKWVIWCWEQDRKNNPSVSKCFSGLKARDMRGKKLMNIYVNIFAHTIHMHDSQPPSFSALWEGFCAKYH